MRRSNPLDSAAASTGFSGCSAAFGHRIHCVRPLHWIPSLHPPDSVVESGSRNAQPMPYQLRGDKVRRPRRFHSTPCGPPLRDQNHETPGKLSFSRTLLVYPRERPNSSVGKLYGVALPRQGFFRPQGCAISRSLQIFRAKNSLISRWRGTAETLRFASFTKTEWQPPSRRRRQPCVSKWRTRSIRFTNRPCRLGDQSLSDHVSAG